MENMQSNIGTFDRYVRLTAGLMALGTGSTMRRPTLTRTLLLSFGAMKIAEGVTGWCPIVHLAERAARTDSSHPSSEHQQKTSQTSADAEQTRARHNPETTDAEHHEQTHRQSRAENTDMQQGQNVSQPYTASSNIAGTPQQANSPGMQQHTMSGATHTSADHHTHDGRTHSFHNMPQ